MQNYQKNARIPTMDFVYIFDQLKLGKQWHLYIWNSFKFKFEVILQIPLQPTSFKWNCPHYATMNITLQH